MFHLVRKDRFWDIDSHLSYPHTVLGALLGTQNGREVEIVNTFELAVEPDMRTVNQTFFTERREQC